MATDQELLEYAALLHDKARAIRSAVALRQSAVALRTRTGIEDAVSPQVLTRLESDITELITVDPTLQDAVDRVQEREVRERIIEPDPVPDPIVEEEPPVEEPIR